MNEKIKISDLPKLNSINESALIPLVQDNKTQVAVPSMLGYTGDSIVINDNFEITTEYFLINSEEEKLEYWITRIHPKNELAEKNLLKKQYAYDEYGKNDGLENLFEMARRNRAIFASNAGSIDISNNIDLFGVQIKDGVVYRNSTTRLANWTLGIDKDGYLNVFNSTYTGDQLVNNYNIVNTWVFTIPLIIDNVEVSKDIYDLYSNGYSKEPRKVIGQVKDSKDIIILTLDGRSEKSDGATCQRCTKIMQLYNCRVAYNLDGGGSNQTIINDIMINNPSDINLRLRPDMLYVDGNINYNDYNREQKEIADARQCFNTLNEMLISRLPKDENSKYGNNMLNAICYIDSNYYSHSSQKVVLENGYKITVSFGQSIDSTKLAFLNIKGVSSQWIKIKHKGIQLKGEHVENKVFELVYDGVDFNVYDNSNLSENLDGKDCNTLIGRNITGYGNSMINKPVDSYNGYFINITHYNYVNAYNYQFFFERITGINPITGVNAGRIWYRTMENSTWNKWTRVSTENDKLTEDLSSKDCNTLIGRNITGYGNSMINKPTVSGNGYFTNITHPTTPLSYNLQTFTERASSTVLNSIGVTNGRTWYRFMEGGIWREWTLVITENKLKSENLNSKDCNTLIGRNITGYGNSMINKPTGADEGYFTNITHPTTPDTYNYQKYTERITGDTPLIGVNTGREWYRTMENGTWNKWTLIITEDYINNMGGSI